MRRFFFYLLYTPSMMVCGVLTSTVGLLLPYRLRMELSTLWNLLMVRALLPLVIGSQPRFEGLENLPQEPYVAVSNHQSEWETLCLMRLLRPATVVLKQSLLSIPFFGWGLRATRPIPIDRSNPREALRQINRIGCERLRQGSNVLIFPEGTRVPPGEVGTYKRAAARLAIDAGSPLVPIVHNAGDCWQRGGIFHPGIIRVRVGAPIDPRGRSADELMLEVEQWTRTTLAELRETPA